MKERSILSSIISLAIFGAISLPVIAQSQRYPTNAEVRILLARFRQQNQLVEDNRTPTEIRNRDTFVRARSQNAPTIAPFLGEWFSALETSYAQTLSIYPSSSRGRVCIIYGDFPDGGEPNSFAFAVGSVVSGQIRIDAGEIGRSLIIKEGNDLALLGIYKDGEGDIWKFSYPKPLKQPTRSSLDNRPEAARIIQQFNTNRCNISPSRGV